MDNDLRNIILGFLAFVAIVTTGIVLTPPGQDSIKACGDSCQHTGRAMLKMDREGCTCDVVPQPPMPK